MQSGKWSLDLSKYAEKKKKDILQVRKEIAFKLFTSIVEKTPVDTGRARGNWQISVGRQGGKVLNRLDKQGSSTAVEESNKLATVQGDESIFIENNLPYITTLEYGGYPNPVKKGSRRKDGKGYEKRSSGGFSKQAPQGMVGLAMANIQAFIKSAIERSR